jgi:hypothetical protein
MLTLFPAGSSFIASDVSNSFFNLNFNIYNIKSYLDLSFVAVVKHGLPD